MAIYTRNGARNGRGTRGTEISGSAERGAERARNEPDLNRIEARNGAERNKTGNADRRVGYETPLGVSTPRASTREGLSGLDLAKAGQMVAILDRIESAGVEVQAARDALKAAMFGEHNPKDVLAELLTVSDACRAIRTFSGAPLAKIARREFPDAQSEVA